MSNDERGSEGAAVPATPSEHPHPIFNWMSVIAGGITAIGITAMAFFFVLGLFTQDGGGYAGLLLLPPFLVAALGSVFVAAGWIRESGRRKRGERSSFFGRYVLDPWQIVRTTGPIVMLGVVALITVGLLSAGAGSVAVIELSESNTFCGEACHAVMSPEYIAYEDSPHSRLACVECHVAPGAEGFLAAKIGGIRQLWDVTLGEVPRPIPTPIHGAPISRELCESCHSPARDVDYKAVTNDYFLNGLEDSPIQLAMVVKVAGSPRGLLEGAGIHYHMQVARKVEFIARDPQRQEIAWVRVTDREGNVRQFSNEGNPLSDEERESLPIHEMQCIDCHSRPAHAFRSPVDSVNRAFSRGKLPSDIPNLKEASVRALDGSYATTADALQGIASALETYYEEEDPDVLEEQSEELATAADALRVIYQRTIFPEMKASWRAHPDNAGHRDGPGCFRCHNDEMQDAEGEPVFSDCVKCHAILAQDDGAIETMADFELGRDFVHPEDSDTFDEFSLCSDCHTGGKDLYD
jgi:hypothetical protein